MKLNNCRHEILGISYTTDHLNDRGPYIEQSAASNNLVVIKSNKKQMLQVKFSII